MATDNKKKDVECPWCGHHAWHPLWPVTRSVPWGKCACSDTSMCLFHQYSDEPMPARPPEEELQHRAQLRYDSDCEEYEEKKRVLQLAEKLLFVKYIPPEVRDTYIEKWYQEVLAYQPLTREPPDEE